MGDSNGPSWSIWDWYQLASFKPIWIHSNFVWTFVATRFLSYHGNPKKCRFIFESQVADEPRYRFVTHLGARVGRLNPSWQAGNQGIWAFFDEKKWSLVHVTVSTVNRQGFVWWNVSKTIVVGELPFWIIQKDSWSLFLENCLWPRNTGGK